MCCEHIVAQKNYIGKLHADWTFSVFFSAVIKALNAHIVKSFIFGFYQSSSLSLPCAPLCGPPGKWKEQLRPYCSHACVKAVWPVCGKSKIQPSAAAAVVGGGTAQQVNSVTYGRMNNIELVTTRSRGRNEKQDKGVASCAAPPIHTGPQCGPGKQLQRLLPEYRHDFRNVVPLVNDVIFQGRCLLWCLSSNAAYCNNGFGCVKNDLMRQFPNFRG